jgi:adenosylmethionine-8-amino-7-oxononanoate aminotransferase
VWRPFTQHAVEPDALEVVRTEGAWLELRDGRRVLDAISSWWVVTHGHRHPLIVEAIRTTAERLDQVIFAGFTHEPAERLAHELVALAPPGLEHVFYSDSGSTSVEVALKMALGSVRSRGEGRDRIVVMEHGYHGDTVGAMSVGARGVFNATYEPLLFAVESVPFPEPGREQATLDVFEAATKDRRAAAFLVEPLVLGAGGMKMYPAWVLAELHALARATGTLFIADEVMTGWGRTGTLFACEQAGIAPDILCTGKGLTGGAVPLAATLATAEIFEAHYSPDRTRTLFHSSSFTANPIACAAALANVDIWKSEPVRERIAELAAWQVELVAELAGADRFSGARACGTVAAVDVLSTQTGYLAEVGLAMRRAFLERDVLLRPLGETVYIMPPYCVTKEQLEGVYAVVADAAR